jgi:ubiquinone/menaquinone biosynthesis C-methylase UbiE
VGGFLRIRLGDFFAGTMPEKPNLVSAIRPNLEDPIYNHFLTTLGASNASHLDVGAGTGEKVIYSASLGLQPIALEYDHDYIIRIKTGCIQGTAKYLPFDNNTFNVVPLMHVLEHLPFYDDTLSEIYRVLKPKGYFLVEVPNKYYLQELFNALYTRFVVDKNQRYLAHCNYFTYSGLKTILSMHGFQVEKDKIYGGLLHGTISAMIRLTLDIFF